MRGVGLGAGWWLRSGLFLLAVILWMPGDWPNRSEFWYAVVARGLVVVASAVAILLRERVPVLLFGVGLFATILGTTGPMALGLFVLASRRPGRDALVVSMHAAITLTIVNVVPNVSANTHGRVRLEGDLWMFMIGTVILAIVLPTVTGAYLRTREQRILDLQRRVERADADREVAQAEQGRAQAQAVAREQRRIAGEMHDSLGYKLVLISMRAQVLAEGQQDPVAVGNQARDILATANAALTDLRDVVGTLGGRQAGARPAPQPGAAGVQALVKESNEAGGEVLLVDQLTTGPDAASLPEVTGRAVYRVAQEALTNAHKHAPGCPVVVRLHGNPTAGVRISIENSLPDQRVAADGNHVGLAGLAARVRLLGGSFEVTQDEGSFLVLAQMPWEPVPAQARS